MSCKHAQTPLVSACVWVLSGFFFVCIAVRKVKDSAARKLNRGQKRKLSGRSRAREERSEKNHHFLFRPWSSLCEAVPLTLRTTKQNNQKTPATQATCVFVQLLVADRGVRDQAVTLFHEQVSAPREVGGGGGYSRELLVGVCRPVLQILTLFQIKKIMPFSSLLFLELK